jgi:hypothetical protein
MVCGRSYASSRLEIGLQYNVAVVERAQPPGHTLGTRVRKPVHSQNYECGQQLDNTKDHPSSCQSCPAPQVHTLHTDKLALRAT